MRIILAVTNDICTDRRVIRIAETLVKLPAQVLVVGRKLKESPELPVYNFQIRRFRMFINKGLLFYAVYNIRLLIFLMVKRSNMLVANDLDTLPAVYLAALFKRIPVIYDCHEYFTEVPELINRKPVKKTWEVIERLLVPHIRHAYTVSRSIAHEYNQKYGVTMEVIRNLPGKNTFRQKAYPKKHAEKAIIYQGSLNIGRGLELAISAMKYMTNTRLIIIGKGDIEQKLKGLVSELSLEQSVSFMGMIMPADLSKYTAMADMGISLEEKLGLNYYYALPNKLFDYIQARIPVLVSDLPEMLSIVKKYNIGLYTDSTNPYNIAELMTTILEDEDKRNEWMKGLETAAQELCWENEENKLTAIYNRVLSGNKA